MKVNRDDLLRFMSNIRRKAGNNPLSDADLINELANYMESNPDCIDTDGVSHPGRYSYSTVGYGIFTLFGERYRMGRIEVFDKNEESGYPVHEGAYTMPHIAANQFEAFIESLETELPINIQIGSYEWCTTECAKDLGFDGPDDLKDPERIKEYRKKQNDKYAQEQGYSTWDELIAAEYPYLRK